MEKKFEIPEAYIVIFSNEDIITTSGEWGYDGLGDNGDEGGLE